MFLHLLARFKKQLRPNEFCAIFNNNDMGRKSYNKLMAKTGVKTDGSAVIRQPFTFHNGNIELAERVFINSGCIFLDDAVITIGKKTLIGPGVKLCTSTHHVDPEKRHSGNIEAPIKIGENCWLGAGVVVLPGVSIGDNSVVAANSVVTQDIPANVLYAGCPAKLKREIP